jgi:aminoglycoside 6'-N-acetyltransferase
MAPPEPFLLMPSTSTSPSVVLRPATSADVPLFERWDRQPHVVSATTDNPAAEQAFEDVCWSDELAAQDEHSRYLIAELDGRPIGAMQMIDPQQESTHYWGVIRANLRALDIWIGEPDCLSKGYGETMMRLAFQLCFAEPAVVAIVIDPLASNERAHRFYRRLGFKPTSLRKFGDDECLVHELTREDWSTRFVADAAAGRMRGSHDVQEQI